MQQAPAQPYHPWSTFADAREEARWRGDRRVGTEHLLVALLREPELAAALGRDARDARAALTRLDAEALGAVGIQAAAVAPPPEPDPLPRPVKPKFRELLHGRIPLTPSAKSLLEATGRELLRGHAPRSPAHVLGAVLDLHLPDPAAELLDALGVDRATARRQLAQLHAAAA